MLDDNNNLTGKLVCGDLCKLLNTNYLEEEGTFYKAFNRDISHMLLGRVISSSTKNVRVKILESKLRNFNSSSISIPRSLLKKHLPVSDNPEFCPITSNLI